MPAQFTPETRDDVTGWLWEGPFATLIREAIPGIAGTDLRRAREYLNACGMVVNVRAGQLCTVIQDEDDGVIHGEDVRV